MSDAAPGPLVQLLARLLATAELGACYCAVLAAKANVLGPDRPKELEELRQEEEAAVGMLRASLAELGGDPDAFRGPCTPDQALDVARTLALLADPGRGLLESLEPLLAVKVAERAAWHAVTELAAARGRPELAASCGEARARQDHLLDRLQAWLAERAGPARDLVRDLGGHGGAGA
jgi:hypothetical protein